jgi:hypothetical protein
MIETRGAAARKLGSMLLVDDGDELAATADQSEEALARQLGPDRLGAIDEALTRCCQAQWLKAASVVFEAIKDGGFGVRDEGHVRVHLRRLIALVDAGTIEAQGNVRRPRFSEVRLSAAR